MEQNHSPLSNMMEDLGSPKKILLIEPPFYNLFKYERWHYPITLTLVGTYLKEKGHEVMIYDADIPTPECSSLTREEVRNNYHLYEKALENKNHPAWLKIREKIRDFHPDIVGITSITPKIDSADTVARITKELFGDKVKVILGGPHAESMTKTFPNFVFDPSYDQIVMHIPGLVDRKPDKKLLGDYECYSPKDLSSILTSTGCPNACTFCSNHHNKIVYRNMASIEQELDEIKESGSKEVYILDDCALSNAKRFKEIGQALHDRGLGFVAGSRLMALSPEKIKEYMALGGRRILVGIESGSQRILDLIQKQLLISEVEKRTQWLNDSGLEWNAFLIAGFPFETLDDLQKTEDLVYRIKPTFASLNRFTPYPGTKIWKDYYMDKQIRFRDLFQLNPNNDVVRLDDKMEEKISQMFKSFDEYNKKSKKYS